MNNSFNLPFSTENKSQSFPFKVVSTEPQRHDTSFFINTTFRTLSLNKAYKDKASATYSTLLTRLGIYLTKQWSIPDIQ